MKLLKGLLSRFICAYKSFELLTEFLKILYLEANGWYFGRVLFPGLLMWTSFPLPSSSSYPENVQPGLTSTDSAESALAPLVNHSVKFMVLLLGLISEYHFLRSIPSLVLQSSDSNIIAQGLSWIGNRLKGWINRLQ